MPDAPALAPAPLADPAPSTTAKTSWSNTLKLSLLLPYIGLIVLLTATIGGITYWAGARTVSSLTERMLQEMVNRIGQSVEHHVSGSSAVLEAAFPVGMAAPDRLEDGWKELRNRLWAATTLHPSTNDYVYYGNLRGQGVGLKRLADGAAEMRLKTDARAHRRYYRLDQIDAQEVYLRTEQGLFDPRTRPWFQQAQSASSHTWTSVYIDFNDRDLLVTRARRVQDAAGTFQGVVATDVSLLALNRFVNELGNSVQGRAFIIEPSGELVAASGMANVREKENGEMERISVHSINDPLIEGVFQEIRHLFHTPASNDESAQDGKTMHMQDSQGKDLLVAYRRVLDDAGMNWVAVVAVPRAAMLTDVSNLVEMVTVVGLLALACALVLGMRVFGKVADEVHQLSHAVRRVGQGAIDTPIDSRRTDELGDLARTFQGMRQELFTDRLTGVSNRSALQHVLAALTAGDGPTAPPFALLFLDLNLFKPLNDRWGHDNGDRALIEVAQRLRQQVRTADHVARLGGDEFVVVLRGVGSLDVAQTLAGKLVAAISAPLTTLEGVPEGEQVHLGASVGIALYPADGRDVQTLLKHADQQMYQDKAKRGAPAR